MTVFFVSTYYYYLIEKTLLKSAFQDTKQGLPFTQFHLLFFLFFFFKIFKWVSFNPNFPRGGIFKLCTSVADSLRIFKFNILCYPWIPYEHFQFCFFIYFWVKKVTYVDDPFESLTTITYNSIFSDGIWTDLPSLVS